MWDPQTGVLESRCLHEAQGVIHLAGENIQGQWSDAKRKAIYDSRIRTTSLIVKKITRMDHPPQMFLCASAAAYGDRGEEILDDESKLGTGFLSDLTRAWEEAASTAAQRGIRTINLRFGMVLDKDRGALAAMLKPFRLGLGGRIGDGRQYWSWISEDDAASAIVHLLENPALAGPINITSPNPVRNVDFTHSLGDALGRPTLLTIPASIARLKFGQVADELLLASIRAVPKKLLDSGFTFRHPTIEEALRAILQKKAAA